MEHPPSGRCKPILMAGAIEQERDLELAGLSVEIGIESEGLKCKGLTRLDRRHGPGRYASLVLRGFAVIGLAVRLGALAHGPQLCVPR